MAKPVWTGIDKPLTVPQLRNLYDDAIHWTSAVPVNPQGGDVFCFRADDNIQKGTQTLFNTLERFRWQ